MSDTKEIIKRLAAINSEVGAIKKERQNVAQKFKYRSIDDAFNELHGLFAKYGVFAVPETLEVENNDLVTQSAGFNGGMVEKTTHHCFVVMKYTFYCAEDCSSIETTVRGESMDMGDKALSKACTMAIKTLLYQMFLIPTEDMPDPDSQSYESVRTAKYEEAINKAETLEQLTNVWEIFKAEQGNPDFTAKMSAKRKQIESKK